MVRLRADKASLATAGRIQAMGQNIAGSDLGLGVFGLGSGGVTELKHGIVDDASLGVSGRSFVFRLWKEDPPTAGASAQRSERYFATPAQIIPQNTEVWFAVRVRSSTWDAETRRIIWQWHEDSPVAGLSPHLSATINGTRLRLIVLHNDNAELTNGNTSQQVIYTDESWQPENWHDFVVQARVDPAAAGSGYVKAWINGALVADYTGPLGYRYDSPKDYAKVGVYHWQSQTNNWHEGAPESVEVRVASVILMRHEPGIDSSYVRSLLDS